VHLPDLSPVTQAALLSTVAILAGAVLVRVTVFLRRQHTSAPPRYPGNWTDNQIRVFERLRVTVGIAVILIWAVLQVAAPSMPQGWPFGLVETLLTVALLLLANAWVSLLFPSKWRYIVDKAGFATTIGVLAGWWITLLGAVLVTIALAVRPVAFPLSIGIFA
jgi:hypothetical protein